MNMTWKVIGVDNFDRERISDFLVQDGLIEEEAVSLARTKNGPHAEQNEVYYRAVRADYKLYVFEP